MSTETYSCFLRLKSSTEEDAIRMQPGSGETHVLYVLLSHIYFLFLNLLEKGNWQLYSFPDSLGDDLIVEVQDSKGKQFGRVLVQVAAIADDPVNFLVLNSYKVTLTLIIFLSKG